MICVSLINIHSINHLNDIHPTPQSCTFFMKTSSTGPFFENDMNRVMHVLCVLFHERTRTSCVQLDVWQVGSIEEITWHSHFCITCFSWTRSSLADYGVHCWHKVEPYTDIIAGRNLDFMSSYLQTHPTKSRDQEEPGRRRTRKSLGNVLRSSRLMSLFSMLEVANAQLNAHL